MGKPMRLVRLAACVAGGIALAAAGYTGYWFVAAGEIEGRIDVATEALRAEGIEVQDEGIEVAGFPFRFDVSLHKPRFHDTRNGWRWAADRLRAETSAWDFSAFTVVPDRRNVVQILEKGEWRVIDTRIDAGRLVIELDEARRIGAMTLDLEGLEVDGLWPQEIARVASLHANGLALDDGDGDADGETLRASLALRNVVLPSGFGEELGETLAFFDVDVSVIGPLGSGGKTSEAIAAWRDAGGTLEVADLRLRWGPLGIESRGTIALDRAMRPIAALTADIIGYGDVIDALIMSNMIPLGDAFIAKVAFNMLAEKPADGGPPVLRSVPVRAQDGTLFVGPVKVAKVPPLPLQ